MLRSITSYVESLSKKEYELLSAIVQFKSSKNSKQLLLLKSIHQSPNKSDEYHCKNVYNSKLNSKYSHLKKKLLSTLVEGITVLPPKKVSKNHFILNELALSKLYYQWNYYCSQGRYALADGILKKINSNPHGAISAIPGLAQVYKVMHRKSSLTIYQIEELEEILEQSRKSQEAFQKLILYSTKVFKTVDFESELEHDSIADIGRFLDSIGSDELRSPLVKNYYLKLNILYRCMTHSYESALENAFHYADWIERKDNPYFSLANIGGGLLMVGNCFMYLEEYDRAIESYKKAIGFFPERSNNQQMVQGCLLRAHIGKSCQKDLDQFLVYLNKETKGNLGLPFSPKLKYLMSCAYFKLGDFDLCLEKLSYSTELYKAKSSWRVAHKVLEMMALIELGQYDLLYYRIDSNRKLLYSLDEDKRELLAFSIKIVKGLIRTGMDFEETYLMHKDKTHEILSHSWNPMGAEVIRFDEWFLAKVEAGKKTSRSLS